MKKINIKHVPKCVVTVIIVLGAIMFLTLWEEKFAPSKTKTAV